MARKLASIQTVAKLEPIEGADKIEKATILGWQCVVKKGEFKEGDPCIYVEIDSVLPDKPEFEFMRIRHFRVRTIRLRGTISQGLVLPVSWILDTGKSLSVGDDVTDAMGIVQYCPKIPTCLTGIMKGAFPTFIPKTDETRVQLLQPILDRYKGTECYVTEKLDGSSCTFYLKDGDFGVCSRNIDLKESEGNAFWEWARKNDVENKLKKLGKNVAIQGELYGNGIQDNSLKLPDRTVAFFNLFWIDEFKYANYHDFEAMMDMLELPVVPILETDYILENDIESLVGKSIAKSVINPKVWREGIVIRPLQEINDLQMSNIGMSSARLTMKVVNPEYLIDNEE